MSCICVLRCGLAAVWKYDEAGSSVVWKALEFEAPTELFHYVTRDVVSQPQLCTRTYITDRDNRCIACLVQRHGDCRALRGVLTCVGEQIAEQLSEPIRIHLGFQRCVKTVTS